MGLCPVCNSELSEKLSECLVCGNDFDVQPGQEIEWTVVGAFDDKLTADMACETLLDTGIPAVLFSRAGVFGAAGLPMTTFYQSKPGVYEISVPRSRKAEATDVLDSVISGGWHRRD